MIDLNGRTALVSGAGRGMGRLAALALADAGLQVAGQDLAPLTYAHPNLRGLTGDPGKGLSAEAVWAEAELELGRVDVLVCAQQINPARPILELDEWDWQYALELNLSAAYLLARLAVPAMRARGGGAIIFLTWDEAAARAHPNPAALAAGQTGLAAFSRAAAKEFLAYNIAVTLVQAGVRFLALNERYPVQAANLLAAVLLPLCAVYPSLPSADIQLDAAIEQGGEDDLIS